MRLVEIRLLDGPNIYALEPMVKLEVAIGRPQTWRGDRVPAGRALIHLAAAVPASEWPPEIGRIVGWVRRLQADVQAARQTEDGGERRAQEAAPRAEGAAPRAEGAARHAEEAASRHPGQRRFAAAVAVHRSADPGHWIVSIAWRGAEPAHAIAEAAFELSLRGIPPERTARISPTDARFVARIAKRIAAARPTPPNLVTDADRRIPIVSISGTNGKSTVTRLITHILVLAGRHVGTTTSDGVLVDGRIIESGDWTGPGGAARILARSDLDVAVLETARGGILLRGVGYESNDASVLTNISSDHLDLQGIHTLPELAEVKAVIARITKPDGWVVLNADDPLVASIARRVRANVAFFSLTDGGPGAPAILRRHLERGGRAHLLRRGSIVEVEGATRTEITAVTEIPIAIGGIARYNVANALAAAGGARAMGATIADVARGLRDFRPNAERSPGRLNLFRVGTRIVIVDFAHNEAGLEAVLSVAEGIAAGAAARTAPITAIIGTAGDRPDDSLRAIGRAAGEHAQRVAIKETPHYLRGRARESIVDELRIGLAEAGVASGDVPVYPSETAALQAELTTAIPGDPGRPGSVRIIVLMTHEEREEVFRLIERLGGRPIDVVTELTTLLPRLQERPRR